MSVYREIEAGYLTRTKDLIPEADHMRDIDKEK